jgi:GAF domain-containing protein
MQPVAKYAAPDTIADSLDDRSGQGRQSARNGQRTAIDAAKILELIQVPSQLTSPDDRVPQLALAAARLVGGESGIVMLLEEVDGGQRVIRTRQASCFTSADKEWTRKEEHAVRDAIVSGMPVLISHRTLRPTGEPAKRRAELRPARSLIACPVRIEGTIVGAIGVVGVQAVRRFRPDDVAVVEIAAWLVAQALHAGRLQKLLRSQFAQVAIAREADHSPDHALAVSGSRPGQLARILGRSFYREMIKLGFESGQVIGAASEIISQLSENLRKHKERWQRSEAGRHGLPAGVR